MHSGAESCATAGFEIQFVRSGVKPQSKTFENVLIGPTPLLVAVMKIPL